MHNNVKHSSTLQEKITSCNHIFLYINFVKKKLKKIRFVILTVSAKFLLNFIFFQRIGKIGLTTLPIVGPQYLSIVQLKLVVKTKCSFISTTCFTQIPQMGIFVKQLSLIFPNVGEIYFTVRESCFPSEEAQFPIFPQFPLHFPPNSLDFPMIPSDSAVSCAVLNTT